MGRFLAVVAILLAAVGCLGFYLGWFHLSTDRSDQKTNITITVDKEKIKEDKEKAVEKVEGVGEKVKEKVKGRQD
jgi:hypothetical protein